MSDIASSVRPEQTPKSRPADQWPGQSTPGVALFDENVNATDRHPITLDEIVASTSVAGETVGPLSLTNTVTLKLSTTEPVTLSATKPSQQRAKKK